MNILLIILFCSILTIANSETIFKGNIIYIKTPSSVTVNPLLINFHRRFDFAILDMCMNSLLNFQKAYKTFCAQIQEKVTSEDSYVVLSQTDFRSAQYNCLQHSAKLPEINTKAQEQKLIDTLKLFSENQTYAGVTYKHGKMYSLSGMTLSDNITHKLCTMCEETLITQEEYDAIKHKYGDEVHWLYVVQKNRLFLMPIAHGTTSCPRLTLFCSRITTQKVSVLNTIAKRSCLQEIEEIDSTNLIIAREIAQFKDQPQNRTKRHIGLAIGAGTLGIETINSMATGSAPLSFIGKSVASLFGFATAEDLVMTKQQLEAHSRAIANISINQELLIEAHTKVTKDLIEIQRKAKAQEHDSVILFANLNNKLAIKDLQTGLQLTMLKMAQAMQAAKQFQTSPYVFGIQDLKDLTIQYRSQNIPLTSRISDVVTALAIVDQIHTFIFAAPIQKPEHDLYFYELRQMPVYHDNKQYRLTLDNKFFAINFVTNEFVIVSASEYRQCTTIGVCTIAGAFAQINQEAPCEILTLKYDKQYCPTQLFEGPTDNFLNYGNITYYSVPQETEIHIVCEADRTSFNQHKTIFGTGQIQTAPGCVIKQNSRLYIRPSYVLRTHQLEANTLFKLLDVPKMFIQFPTTELPQPANVSIPPFRITDISSIEDIGSVVFNKDTTFAEMIRIATYIISIASICATIYCCFPKCRLWFNGCCFFQRPTKYWFDVKKYQGHDIISPRKQDAAQNTYLAIEKVDKEIEMQPLNKPPENDFVLPIQPDIEAIENAPYPFRKLHKLYEPLFATAPPASPKL